ncbi:hypothetical protein NDU88_006657 [Pleurodeles waltl]|uniref:Uncharacterized protein n=1 Tax=Pleurodeles waltl TaxID=8319 RepID=A0AAV7TXE2_PLEWA|nr:hypothetical protein NDU88_006657 [Pleurodeles waltl]
MLVFCPHPILQTAWRSVNPVSDIFPPSIRLHVLWKLSRAGRVVEERQPTRIPPSDKDSSSSTAMPSGKSSSKHSRQLLFSEAIAQPKVMAAQQSSSNPAPVSADSRPLDSSDRILQEITAVGRRLEVMDLKVTELSAASAFIRMEIACFSEKVVDFDQHLSTVEDHIGMLPGHNAELLSLRDKITDLEDWSRRDNVRFFGIPEKKEGTNINLFPQSLLPELTGLTVSPPLEFQRVHRVGPPRSISSGGPPDHCVLPSA